MGTSNNSKPILRGKRRRSRARPSDPGIDLLDVAKLRKGITDPGGAVLKAISFLANSSDAELLISLDACKSCKQ